MVSAAPSYGTARSRLPRECSAPVKKPMRSEGQSRERRAVRHKAQLAIKGYMQPNWHYRGKTGEDGCFRRLPERLLGYFK